MFGFISRLKQPALFGLILSLAALPSISRADGNWTGATDKNYDNIGNWGSNPTGGSAFVDTNYNFPVIDGYTNTTIIPNDCRIAALQAGAEGPHTGRIDVRSGLLQYVFWGFVGDWTNNATLNIADTTTPGGTFTGFGLGSGSFVSQNAAGNNNLMIGLYYSTGVLNMNTTGHLDAQYVRVSPNGQGGTTGTFNLDNGTVNASADFEVGSDYWGINTATGRLNMSGGSINAGGTFRTGGAGTGITTQTGGTINATGYFVCGQDSGSVGTHNISGGSINCPGIAQIGQTGTGTLNLTNGTVTVGNYLQLGTSAGGVGTVNLVGGTLSVSNIQTGAGSGTFNFNGGTLLIPGSSTTNFWVNRSACVANVQAGGANIDTAGYDVTLGQNLSGTGPMTKLGLGTLTLSGANTYSGTITINNGTLALAGTGTLAGQVVIPSGKIFDVSALTVPLQNTVSGVGAVSGNATAASGMAIYPATQGTAGILTFSNNLDMSSAGSATFDVSTSGTSGNDQVAVKGNLALSSSDTIHISALSGSANLDTANDYVLFQVAGTLTMPSKPSLVFDGTAPANKSIYWIATSGNNVVLQNSGFTAPSVTASASPSTLVRNQSTKITAVVTPGSGAIASVTVNVSSIGGSSSAALVQSNSTSVYTNTFVVSSTTTDGSKALSVNVTDVNTLAGSASVSLQVNARNEVWTGAGNGYWSDNADWTTAAPGLSGDGVTFAGSTGLTPNMTNNYSVTSLTFANGAGSFTLGSPNNSTLSLAGSLTNNSGATETLTMMIPTFTGSTIINAGKVAIGGAAQWGGGTYGGAFTIASGAAFDHASSANQTNSGTISGGGNLLKTGSGTLVMNTRNTFTGSVNLGAGTTIINPGNNANNGTFSYVSGITVSSATLQTGPNGLFGWDSTQSKPITLNAGGTLTTMASGQDVNITNLTLNGGTLAGGPSGAWGSFNLKRAGGAKIMVTADSTITATDVGLGTNNPVDVAAGKTLTWSGSIHDLTSEGVVQMVKSGGTGTLILTGTNTYTGGTTISAGTLQIGNGGTSGSIVGGVTNNGSLVFNASANSGISLVTGTGSLTNLGTGTLVVSNCSLNGSVSVLAGTLRARADLGFSCGDFTVGDGATFAVNLADGTYSAYPNNSMTFSGNNTLSLSYGTISATPAPAIIAGPLTHGTKTTINISGSGFTQGQIIPLISASTAPDTNGFVLGTLPPGVKGVLFNDSANYAISLNVTSAVQNLTWAGSEDGSTAAINWDVNGSSNWYLTSDYATHAKYLQYNGNTLGDNVSFGDYGLHPDGTNYVNVTTAVVPSTLDVPSGSPYVITGSGSIGGSTALNKSGSADVYLLTANTYTGGNNLSAGTLIITNDNALGAGANTVTLSGGTLRFGAGVTSARSVNLTAASTISAATNTSSTLSGNISGAGSLTKAGDGTVTLGGSNSIGGTITVSAGNATVTGSISGGSTLTQSGTGTLTVSGAYTGVSDTLVNGGGALSLAGSGSLTSPRMLLAASSGTTGTLNIGGNSTVTNNYYVGSGGWWYDYALGLGVDDGHTGNLNMSGGTLMVNGSVWVGCWGGSGNWTQTGGTTIVTNNFWVGALQDNNTAQPNGSIGTAVISNATVSALFVGVGEGGNGSGNNPSGRVATSRSRGTLTVANGGVVNSENDLQIGRDGEGSFTNGVAAWGSYGILNINNGGIVNVGSTIVRWLTMGRYDSIDATLNINSGGTLNLNAGTDMMINEGNNTGIRVVNVQGLLQGTNTGGTYIDLNRNGTAGGTTTFNISNGGVVAVDAIVGKTNCTLNFDNGTLRATANDPNFIGSGFTVNINAGGATLDSNGKNPTVPGILAGSGNLTKTGIGTVSLNGTNTYTGVTTVNGGGIGGRGVIAGSLVANSGGGLVPSNIGTNALTINGNITLNAGSTNVFNVNGTTPANGRVIAGANVTYGGVLNIVSTGTLTPGQQFQLFSGAGATNTSNFASIVSTDPAATFSFTNGVLTVVSYTAINPNPPQLQVSYNSGTGIMSLSWPTNAGWILQSNSVSLANSNAWFNYPANGSVDVTTVNVTVNPAKTNVFYRMLKP